MHSARYATDGHDFAANNELLLRNLEGVGNRRARFRTVISLILDGEEHLFEGIVEGHIAQCASGSEGFGYDPLFIPEGSAKTYAEMDPAEKNALSHRGRAVRKLAEFLHNRGKQSLPIILSTITTSLVIAYVLHRVMKIPGKIST